MSHFACRINTFKALYIHYMVSITTMCIWYSKVCNCDDMIIYWGIKLGNANGFLCARHSTRRFVQTVGVHLYVVDNTTQASINWIFIKQKIRCGKWKPSVWRNFSHEKRGVLFWVWVRKGKETWLCHQIPPNLEQCLSLSCWLSDMFYPGNMRKVHFRVWLFFPAV
jgi:hypothetical protein